MEYVINGVSYGMVLFLLTSGLTLIYGVMSVVNLAHGVFYLLGAYLGLTVIRYTGNFFVGVIFACLCLGLLGLLVYRLFFAHLLASHRAQILLTYGLIFIIADMCLLIWGGWPLLLPKPSFLQGVTQIGSSVFPTYRLALIIMGGILFCVMWLLLAKTRWGAIVRAGADDIEMSGGLGINIPLLFSLTFGFGALLGGLAGVLGGALLGVYPGADWEVLIVAFVVIVIGGLGSLEGALVASILVGLITNIGNAFFPEFAMFLVFALVIVIIAVKPSGLFGRA